MRFVWDEPKRLANLKKHGLDFADAEKVFAGPMVLIDDSREDYDEQRMIGIGLLDCLESVDIHVNQATHAAKATNEAKREASLS